MAVYERTWRRYDGPQTAERWRLLVITRFALEGVFASRLFTAFYAACTLPSVVGLLLVYLTHNTALMSQIGASTKLVQGLTMAFFQKLFIWQAVPAFFVSVMIGPGLIAPDLANSALPLYLSRPITRRDYVLGKMAVLLGLLSPVTWVGGLAVWFLQATLEHNGWWHQNLRIAIAYLVGHGIWIVVISLLSLAVSAFVRFKPVAVGALIGLYLFLGAMALAINSVTGTHVGSALDLVYAVFTVVSGIFDPTATTDIPIWAGVLSLACVSVFSILLLNWKLRAHEVVR
jgi:ABC-2 type transport system permease protein